MEIQPHAQHIFSKLFCPQAFVSSLTIHHFLPYARNLLEGRPSGGFLSRGYHSVRVMSTDCQQRTCPLEFCLLRRYPRSFAFCYCHDDILHAIHLMESLNVRLLTEKFFKHPLLITVMFSSASVSDYLNVTAFNPRYLKCKHDPRARRFLDIGDAIEFESLNSPSTSNLRLETMKPTSKSLVNRLVSIFVIGL